MPTAIHNRVSYRHASGAKTIGNLSRLRDRRLSPCRAHLELSPILPGIGQGSHWLAPSSPPQGFRCAFSSVRFYCLVYTDHVKILKFLGISMRSSKQESVSVESTVQTSIPSRQWKPSDALGWSLLAFLLLQYIVFVSLSDQSRVFWEDEGFTYYTASVSSVGRVLHVQMTSPVGIEPPLYPILAHAFLVVFPHHHKAIRIPAAIGFLVLILCTFFFLKRHGGVKLAVIATALLLASQSLYYASEGRPYGVALGMWGASLLFWQSARHSTRWLPLGGLAVAVAIAINTHYYAVLMPIPIVIAELICFRRGGAHSWRVLFAIAIGYTSVVFWLPFLKAASQYAENYYSSFKMSDLASAYRYLLSWLPISKLIRDFISVPFLLFVVAGICILVRRRAFEESERSAEWMALCISCIVPFFGVALAYESHGMMWPRYVLYPLIGFCALAAVGIGALVRGVKGLYIALILILAVASAQEVSTIRDNIAAAKREVQPLPPISPDETVVISDAFKFMGMESEDEHPSPRLAYVYDRKQEMKYFHSESTTREILNAAQIVALPVYDADNFLKNHSTFVVAAWRDYDSWWFHSWSDKNLKIDSVKKEGWWTVYHVSVLPPAQT
jgi:hypothetical protein